MAHPTHKPSLAAALRLLCPYCKTTPLRPRGAFFSFAPGCAACDYSYEREAGYFTGASWMVNFPTTGVLSFVLAALLLWRLPHVEAVVVAAITSVFTLAFGVWFMPYSMALWLYADHCLHPLDHDDHGPQPAADPYLGA